MVDWPIITNGAEMRAVWGDDFGYVRDSDVVRVWSTGQAYWTDACGDSSRLCTLSAAQLTKLCTLRGLEVLGEQRETRVGLAACANRVAARARNGEAVPTLTADSNLEALCGWLQWCDPNGCHTPEAARADGTEPHDFESAWSMVAAMLQDELDGRLLPGRATRGEPTDRELASLDRLIHCAKGRSGQSSKCADFLLSWWNGQENGGFDLAHLWSVDDNLSAAMVDVFGLVARLPVGTYVDAVLFGNRRADIEAIYDLWRAPKRKSSTKKPSKKKAARHG